MVVAMMVAMMVVAMVMVVVVVAVMSRMEGGRNARYSMVCEGEKVQQQEDLNLYPSGPRRQGGFGRRWS